MKYLSLVAALVVHLAVDANAAKVFLKKTMGKVTSSQTSERKTCGAWKTDLEDTQTVKDAGGVDGWCALPTIVGVGSEWNAAMSGTLVPTGTTPIITGTDQDALECCIPNEYTCADWDAQTGEGAPVCDYGSQLLPQASLSGQPGGDNNPIPLDQFDDICCEALTKSCEEWDDEEGADAPVCETAGGTQFDDDIGDDDEGGANDPISLDEFQGVCCIDAGGTSSETKSCTGWNAETGAGAPVCGVDTTFTDPVPAADQPGGDDNPIPVTGFQGVCCSDAGGTTVVPKSCRRWDAEEGTNAPVCEYGYTFKAPDPADPSAQGGESVPIPVINFPTVCCTLLEYTCEDWKDWSGGREGAAAPVCDTDNDEAYIVGGPEDGQAGGESNPIPAADFPHVCCE
eukprot:g14450.t1